MSEFFSIKKRFVVWIAIGCVAILLSRASADDGVGPDLKLLQNTTDRAIQYLTAHQQPDGSLSPELGIGPTCLATMGMLRCGRSPSDPAVAKSLAYLEEYTQESGGIHKPGTFISNYETCVAIACFKEANRKGKYDNIIRDAEKFIRGMQWDENRKKDKTDIGYGGSGYGAKTRAPDLSNTAYLVDSLKECGAKSDDPAIQKALAFVSRCQNLESEHNTTKFASRYNDGGFYYTPMVGNPEKEPDTQSYGSMTYSGLKSMIYAGLTKDDPRVKAAFDWIKKNYDVKTNPGRGEAGLFYYYHTFAKTFSVLGIDEIEDAKGVKHDWRRDLTVELARRQREDGSWVNKNTQWQEGDPNLTTAFALLSLSYCRPPVKENEKEKDKDK
jgi:squalene-hopene/tetraprenyl-beta-curcumene cyclase